ncbi:MAG: molybdenum cofactor guanylyltransferase [Bacteroidales bacterium]|nr:molybdenum cofactor guanylyltransferase [Bacteroidales bacterium]MCF8326694.1 molybdenum cofactor guanylyltransferase [Bacteroidales bacterium]
MDRHLQLAILSGGHNTRFNGYSKALVNFNGIPVYQRIMNAAEVQEAIVIVNSKKEQAAFSQHRGISIYSDIIPDKGPLSGVHAALEHAKADYILLMPSDLPLMNSKTIRFLIQNINSDYEAIVPVSEGTIHPLSAVYAKRAKEKLESFLYNAPKTSVKNFLNQISPLYIEIPTDTIFQQAFLNMNTFEDFHSFQKIANNENQ